MAQARLIRTPLLVLLVLLATSAPALAQEGQLVSQSLWGVKHDVGLTVVKEFGTNYADRPFWASRPSGEGIRVAIVDTGIAPDHPDLQDVLACDHCWKDLVNGRAQPYDDHGHGTHVAGIVAGRGHLQLNPLASYFPTGARGMAPGADLIVAKAMNASGAGQDTTVAQAIEWALDPDGQPGTQDGAQIIHLSLGIEAPPSAPQSDVATIKTGSETEAAVQKAVEQGVFVVMSAGNQGTSGPAPPGDVQGVLAVGALDGDGEILSFSNTGPGVDVYAPGVVTSTWPVGLDVDGIQDGYVGLAGTSQAAPVVTGTLALALEADPSLVAGGGATKVAHIEELVRRTGTPLAPQGDPPGVQLAANDLVAAVDKGAEGVAWDIVATLLVLLLLVVGLVLRVVFRLLAVHAQRHEEKKNQEDELGPPPGRGAQEQAPPPPPEQDEQRPSTVFQPSEPADPSDSEGDGAS